MVRTKAFRAKVLLHLPVGSLRHVELAHTAAKLPNIPKFAPVRRAAATLGLRIEHWLFTDADETDLEACQANWRPAVRQLSHAPSSVPSVAASVAAFNRHVLPMERAHLTRGKCITHRRTVLTWAVWKGVLPQLLPMSNDLLRAFLWDALAFETSLAVLRQAINAIPESWRRRGTNACISRHRSRASVHTNCSSTVCPASRAFPGDTFFPSTPAPSSGSSSP